MAKRTTTAYVILGLLSTRDWSAYALAEQLGKGVKEVWPRADRQMYNAPKRLVEQGLITSRKEPSDGSRERTVYSITEDGHTALREWLATEAAPPGLEFEGMIRVLLADNGSIEDLRKTLHGMADHARASLGDFAQLAEFMLETEGGTMPEHQHLFAMANRFMIDHFDNMRAWSEWALAETESWSDPSGPESRDQARAILERSIQIAQDSLNDKA